MIGRLLYDYVADVASDVIGGLAPKLPVWELVSACNLKIIYRARGQTLRATRYRKVQIAPTDTTRSFIVIENKMLARNRRMHFAK